MSDRPVIRTRSGLPDAIIVERDECARWREDGALRAEVQEQIAALGVERGLLLVTTLGGYVVDVWQAGVWQSGAGVVS